jgi:hypothetical protein
MQTLRASVCIPIYIISIQQIDEVAMNTLADRERAFKAKCAHDAEIRFKVTARRIHLLGFWAASLLHITTQKQKVMLKKSSRPG